MAYGSMNSLNFDATEISKFQHDFVSSENALLTSAQLHEMIALSTSISYDTIKEDLFVLWTEIAIRANKLNAVNGIVDTIAANQSRYAVIEAATSVPWFVVAVIHALEASLNFRRHLHNGDPLTARTVHVPAGRPVSGRPPFTWEESAIDAIRFDGLDDIANWNIERILYTLEKFNGFGYRKYHPEVKSPYLWSFSNQYTRGKYVADGSWSPDAISQQCGAAVLLRRMTDRGLIDEIPSELRPSLSQADIMIEDEDAFAEGVDTFGSITSQQGPPAADALPLDQQLVRLGVEDAKWPDNPANAPDTWHLPAEMQDAEFSLTASVVRGLISVGRFEPDTTTNGRLVISLRGCAIADGSDSKVDAASIRLKAVKPNHENFRCLIGCFDTATGLISLYIASTVPRRTGMLKFYNKIKFGTPGPNCNMLPTGCYEQCVGTHGGSAGAVEYVLRLGDGPTSASAGPATVLRTVNDLIYGTLDMWDNTRPADNIHPAFLASSFSSLGCLTLRGRQTPNGNFSTGTGEWKLFRTKVGFAGENRGKRFDNLLVTGHEAAAVATALDKGSIDDLVCLRQGSRGSDVRSLQTQLGLAPDDAFGAGTCQELVTQQRRKLGFATGTYSKSMAALLGFNF